MPFFYVPSQKYRAIAFRATAAFAYLLIFQSLEKTWWSMALMWWGLVVIKWIDSLFPWSNECPAGAHK